jgi:hypothetical protein
MVYSRNSSVSDELLGEAIITPLELSHIIEGDMRAVVNLHDQDHHNAAAGHVEIKLDL